MDDVVKRLVFWVVKVGGISMSFFFKKKFPRKPKKSAADVVIINPKLHFPTKSNYISMYCGNKEQIHMGNLPHGGGIFIEK